MLIATYNVNSVNARIENLSAWLKREQPDAVLLQEIKTEFNGFPFFELQSLGYDAKILGQKSYNGVAVVSRHKMRTVQENLPGFDDEQARYLEVAAEINGREMRLASVYLPNGNPPYNNPDDDSRYAYKLRWIEAFYRHAVDLLELRIPVVIGGDFNVIMAERDVYDPEAFRSNALFRPEVRKQLRALGYLGYYDAFRTLHSAEAGYTFWDYTGGALQNDQGMRIDYLWLSPDAADMLKSCVVDKTPRLAAKPSDHTVLKAVLE